MENNKTKAELFFDKINSELGYSLELMKEPKKEVIGREKELHNLTISMERVTTVTALLADAGVGKTSLVREWYKRQKEIDNNIELYSLNVGKLGGVNLQGRDSNAVLQERLENLIPKLEEYQDILREKNSESKVVLFIDELHVVVSSFGIGNKVGGDSLKKTLEDPKIKIITATTKDEYNLYIASDNPFARRFNPMILEELSQEETLEVLKSWFETFGGKELLAETDEKVFKYIILSNRLYREQEQEPAKSIKTLDAVLATYKVDKTQIDKKLVNRVFKTDYSIDLDFKVSFERTFNIITRRVHGQPLALHNTKKIIKRLSFPLDKKNKPKATMLFVGSTGTGKTEMAKAMTEGIYGDDKKLRIIAMSDYSSEYSEEYFRKTIAGIAAHDPSSTILLDEIEKAHRVVRNALLPILDEGLVTYKEVSWDGYEKPKTISLKNNMIIATTNAAKDIFQNEAKYSKTSSSLAKEDINKLNEDLEREWKDLEKDVRDALIGESFTPEILGRFQQIVPFYGLNNATKISIVDKRINEMIDLIREIHGIEILLPRAKKWEYLRSTEQDDEHSLEDERIHPLTMYVIFDANMQGDTADGGARKILRSIDEEILSKIIDAVHENPDCDKFEIDTNGKCVFEDRNSRAGDGGIIVEPHGVKNEYMYK